MKKNSLIRKICSIVLLMITLVSFCFMGGCASKGVILELEEAYELGLISREELQQIANYNNRIEGSPYNVTEIKKSTQKGICKAYVKFLENETDWENIGVEDVGVRRFYGRYRHALVVDMHVGVTMITGCPERYVEIDGILFHFVRHYELGDILVFIEK